MKRLLLSVLALGFACTASYAQIPPAYAARLQQVLDSTCNLLQIKGASAAVYVPGSGMWKGVYGESYSGQPITSNMAVPLNSNTKTYVSALMLKLQEDGKLRLDDSIGTWIQGYPNINGQITIRQLLNHTSGLYSYTDSAAFADSIEADFARIWQPAEMLQFVGAPLFAPGVGWSYSNTNYLLAGIIISQVTGKPVEQAIRVGLLTPQGLGNTWFYPQEPPTQPIPHFWFSDGMGGEVDGQIFSYTPESFYSAASSAGALFSTAEDNAMFWHKLASGQIINAASLDEWRQTIPLTRTGIGYGLGMFRYPFFNTHVVYEHGGTGAGAINENLVDSASGVSISVLTNQEKAGNNDLLYNVVIALHRVTLDQPTAVGGVAGASSFELYPNPAKGRLIVQRPAAGAVRYSITDALGQVVRTGSLEKDKEEIGIGALNSGLYYLRLSDAQAAMGKSFTVLQ
jgi:D-alanyl-D-alanine carboxypeptidase